jgi:transposase
MIEPDVRSAIYTLHQQGMSLREISRRLHVSRKTVRAIVKQQGKLTRSARRDKKQIDAELLERLYRQCKGWAYRIHEKLTEEEGIEIGYSTLTRMLRELGLSCNRPTRCDRVADQPGVEMQHDTTVYRIRLSGRLMQLIASLVYLRYCKRRYLKFYRTFNRFAMKCFLHEALMFWRCAPRLCIIDNTNLARLHGAGSRAVIVPEMEAFSERYGFQFVCHAIDHPNRKAGNERSFWSVETNFLPGRTFTSLEDLNEQARQWATERMEHRPLTKARVVPAQLFEHERHYLNPLPEHLPAPYQAHYRVIDQYGYVPLAANYYWVPGTDRGDVKVLQYADRLKIFRHHDCLAEYPLPPDGTRSQYFSPPGQPKPRHQPRKRRRDAKLEEERLRAVGEEVSAYLDFVLSAPGVQRHRFTRELFAISRKLTPEVFRKTARRAHRYRIVKLATLQRIAWLCMTQEEVVLPEPEVDEDLHKRPAYQEGYLTDQPDLSVYDQSSEEKQEEEEDDDEPF